MQGKVSGVLEFLEKPVSMSLGRSSESPIREDAMPEQLQEMLNEQKESSVKLQWEVETMKLRNELEVEQLQQEQWEAAIKRLKESREQMQREHVENMEKMQSMGIENPKGASNQAVAWLQSQLNGTGKEPTSGLTGTRNRDRYDPKQTRLEELYKQQDEIQEEIADITRGPEVVTPSPLDSLRRSLGKNHREKTEQELLLEQIRTTLAPKDTDKDPNKALLKALMTAQNKTAGAGGMNTLNSDILNKLTGEGEFSMAEWLASLNKQ